MLLVSKGSFGELGWLSSVGDWLVLVTAHTWALYTIATRDVSRAHDPLAVIFAVCVPAAALALGVMFFEADWGKLAVLPLDAVVALVFLGVLGTALAHWFWQVGLSRVGAAEAGAFIYLEPVATTALAVPYLGESFGGFAAAGGVLVLAGVWMAQKGSSSRRAPPSSRPGKGEAG
ncbi:MAG: DMT family transporter [Acidobacteriota bacterium]